MNSEYIRAAMHRATYEVIPGDGTWYGEIPGFDGVYANAPSHVACRDELLGVLVEWIDFRLARKLELPLLKTSHDGCESPR